MHDSELNDAPEVQEPGKDRFSILVCIDGTPESHAALKYAVRIGSGTDADLTLLYVRPIDQGLRTGGLQISVARQNMLEWGLDLPGMKVLKEAQSRLVDLEWMGENWEEEFTNTSVAGDPLGDHITHYTNDEGRSITLKLLVAPSVERGILNECEAGGYDMTIIARSEDDEPTGLGYIEPQVAEQVAVEHDGTVLVTRSLEESHGHLLCVTDDEVSIRGAQRDAQIAARCLCPIYLFAVARDEDGRPAAERAVENAKQAIEASGIKCMGEKIAIGDPVEEIIKEGRDYSVIVISPTMSKTGWRRLFTASISNQVLLKAENSVMFVR